MIENGESDEQAGLKIDSGTSFIENMPEPSEKNGEEAISSLNSQITASIAELQDAFKNSSGEDALLISYLVMAQAAGLAMLNAVNQQHHQYILQNAVTTAAVKAALEAKPEDAIKIVNDAVKNNTLLETLKGLKIFMDDIINTYNELRKKTVPEKKETEKPAVVKSRAKKK